MAASSIESACLWARNTGSNLLYTELSQLVWQAWRAQSRSRPAHGAVSEPSGARRGPVPEPSGARARLRAVRRTEGAHPRVARKAERLWLDSRSFFYEQ
ncbi:hypothetical protein NDU88_000969 [Pleurodeles waltl]|uniref:Uncharacterized protein n=1 Tax=Pleurodeles waltl TaxID=8319 RepID=A0AAV7V6W0_PLEWA|nr:hypothetical protein NDU88_000969 [Pleurodeles waltl]